MEAARSEANEAKGDHEGRKKAVSLVAQKYFYLGMPRAEADKPLGDFKAQDFNISEDRHEGGRHWLDGELKPYSEASKRIFQNQIPPGMGRITVTKDYGRSILVITKFPGLTLYFRDAESGITDVQANITFDFI
ncbi:MAG: hypothetical protein LBI87_14905 [Candidatus Accumulibacter sp.]|jgi:hypothetical protein|nr:hypothetical protein [Accumulibacter sp.]